MDIALIGMTEILRLDDVHDLGISFMREGKTWVGYSVLWITTATIK